MQRVIKNRVRVKDNSRIILSEKIIGDDGINGKYRKKDIYKNKNYGFEMVNYIEKNYNSYCAPLSTIRNKYITVSRVKI